MGTVPSIPTCHSLSSFSDAESSTHGTLVYSVVLLSACVSPMPVASPQPRAAGSENPTSAPGRGAGRGGARHPCCLLYQARALHKQNSAQRPREGLVPLTRHPTLSQTRGRIYVCMCACTCVYVRPTQAGPGPAWVLVATEKPPVHLPFCTWLRPARQELSTGPAVHTSLPQDPSPQPGLQDEEWKAGAGLRYFS